MFWFEVNENKYEMIVEDPFTCEDRTIAEVYYDEEEQTWAWVNTTIDVAYYGFETADEAKLDCEQSMNFTPECDYDDDI